MANAFVPNKRRVRFDLTLRIIDLNNVPLVSGTSIVNWHLPHSSTAEHRGRTAKCVIREHRVAYDYERRVGIRMTVGKDGMLQECIVAFEVMQEYSAAGRGERIRLGEVKLNLAEYVEASEAAPPTSPAGGQGGELHEGVVRRYLMQDSKINSTLKIGIFMRYMEGTRDYIAPPLKTAPVFGGIAGIISSSEPASTTHGVASQDYDAAREASANMPNLSRANRELGEMQDMYRRTLAAHLFSAPGELKADDAIEDIFAGGDGWGPAGRPNSAGRLGGAPHKDGLNSGIASGGSTPIPTHDPDISLGKTTNMNSHTNRLFRALGGRTKHSHNISKNGPRGKGEILESEVREDLRSWSIGKTFESLP